MTDKERIIAFLQKLLPNDFVCGHIAVTFNDDGSLFITVSNQEDEQEEETTFVYDEYTLPTCEKCGFHPFAGYIPTIKWMKERVYMKCPRCGRAVKWE